MPASGMPCVIAHWKLRTQLAAVHQCMFHISCFCRYRAQCLWLNSQRRLSADDSMTKCHYIPVCSRWLLNNWNPFPSNSRSDGATTTIKTTKKTQLVRRNNGPVLGRTCERVHRRSTRQWLLRPRITNTNIVGPTNELHFTAACQLLLANYLLKKK